MLPATHELMAPLQTYKRLSLSNSATARRGAVHALAPACLCLDEPLPCTPCQSGESWAQFDLEIKQPQRKLPSLKVMKAEAVSFEVSTQNKVEACGSPASRVL